MVVEQGYTRIPSSGTVVSMGAVLQNTTDKVAYRTSPDLAISTLRSIPETADLNKTEVTAYCDFNRPPRSTELGAPIN